jgi:hypothetical protein
VKKEAALSLEREDNENCEVSASSKSTKESVTIGV